MLQGEELLQIVPSSPLDEEGGMVEAQPRQLQGLKLLLRLSQHQNLLLNKVSLTF